METTVHKAKNPFTVLLFRGVRFCKRGAGFVICAAFLAGVISVIILGSLFALSTAAFALGGGGGGKSAPVPKITEVVDPVAKLGDETAETRSPIAEATVGTVSFGRSSSVLAEGIRVAPSLRVRLDKVFSRPITVFLNGSGTGTIGEDVEMPGSVTFEPGEKVKLFRLVATDDALGEGTETITISISGNLPEGLSFGRYPTHNIIIHDNDKKPMGEDIIIERDAGEISIIHGEGEYVRRIEAISLSGGGISVENRGTVGCGMSINERGGDGGLLIENHGFVDCFMWVWFGVTGSKDANKIVNHGTVGGDIRVRERGSGEISIENYGYVEDYIDARQIGESDGDISIENHGTVGSYGNYYDYRGYYYHDHSRGRIRARIGGEGDISIMNAGYVENSITAIQTGDGDISIENHGTIGGYRHRGDSYIRAWNAGEGDISIKNHGSVYNFIEARRRVGEGDISIENHGTVGGGVKVEHRGDNGVVRFDGNIMGEQNSFEGKTVHLGDVVFGGSWNDELEVIGGYEASDGTRLKFYVFDGESPPEIDPSEWDSDLLKITGDVTGRSLVSLIMPDAIPSSFTTDSGPLIEVDGAAQADNFVGEQTVGAFRYVLEYDFDNLHRWRFINRGLSDTAVKTSQIVDEIAKNIETPPTTNLGKQTKKLGLWGERHGSRTTIGLNALATRWMGGNMLVGTSMSKNSSTSNNIDVGSQITALTANWERKGFYVDGRTQYASFTSDVSTDRLSVVQDNEGTGVNTSIDLGYRFALPFGGMLFEVAPQVQLVWSRVNFDDFVGPHGELVSLEDGGLVTGRLGLSWDGEWQDAGGFGRVYGGMNLRGAVDGKTSVNISGISIASERKGLSVDGKLGLSYKWDKGYAVYGEAKAVHRDDANEVRANLGVRIDF